MKLITYTHGGSTHVGAHASTGSTVVSFTQASGGDHRFASMLDLIQAGEEALEYARSLLDSPPDEAIHTLNDIVLGSPIPNPPRVRDCSLFIEHLQPAFLNMARIIAVNSDDPEAEYERLIATGNFERPKVFSEQIIYYVSDHTAISGPNELIIAPPETRQLDYELEFAAVVGKTVKDVGPQEAEKAIFGYTILNDWSCRDVQAVVMASQLGPARGKDFDGSNTLGPCIVTADEIGSPYGMDMAARVNGEEWSRGSTSAMHHTFADAITYLSSGRTIYAGEVIGSGTVLSGSPFEIGKRLKDGDEVELEVAGLGILRNRVQLSS
ncbi:fumarylacetoacetate hydrolase family protein [Paenarthrobacter nitroguajacolicus]|uniref:fumarylacetoacetate hydrolase family protein n=1 Tax=Paenarthrobacter nitroguajacolicus TaxID=211146 RepID=UPI0040555F1E